MADTVIKMYAAVTGDTQNALANIDIPEDGTITGVEWAIRADLDADSEHITAELSFIATNQIVTNDVRGVLTMACAQISLTTSGIANTQINKYVPMMVDVAGGERLYINTIAASGVGASVYCMIHFEFRRQVARRSQRRRQ